MNKKAAKKSDRNSFAHRGSESSRFGLRRKSLLAATAACALMFSMSATGNFLTTKLKSTEPDLRVKSLSYHTFEKNKLIQPALKLDELFRKPSASADDQSSQAASKQSIEDVLVQMKENSVRFISSHYQKVTADNAREIVDQAFVSGKQHDIDPFLILAIIATESSFNPKAGSAAGAKGLMQVHVKVHADRFKEFGGAKAVFEIEPAIEVGTRILKEYLNKTGSLKGALKYYVGAANLTHDGGYARKVLAMRSHLQLAANGEIEAARIQARAPSKFPENHQDHKDFASYAENMKLEKFPSLLQPNAETNS